MGERPPTQEPGNVWGIEAVVCGFAALEGFHRQRVPKAKRNAFPGPEVGQPLPGAETVAADDQIGSGGRDGLQNRFWASGHVPVEQTLSRLVENTESHGAGMPIEAAVKLVLLGVEAHEVFSSGDLAT